MSRWLAFVALVAIAPPALAQAERSSASEGWIASIAQGALRSEVPALTSPVPAGQTAVQLPQQAVFVEVPQVPESTWQRWLSGYVAGVGYISDSTRSELTEMQLRADLWNSPSWSVHFGVTSDLVYESSETLYLDLNGGGRWAPWASLPIWFWGEAHGLIGPDGYGMGGGGMLGVGGLWRNTHLELGAGGLAVSAGGSFDVAAQLGHTFAPWLDATLLGLYTRSSGDHFAYGLEVRLGPFSDLSVNLRWLGGERVYALDRLGTAVENLPDTMHDTFTASVSFPIRRVTLTVGATGRWATETTGENYAAIGGYAGLAVKF